MTMAGPLQLQAVTKLFHASGSSTLGGVRDISLEIPQGEGFSLLGPSGCGKSTTLRLIGGFEQPDHGRIFHKGKDITSLPPQKRDIRTVFQRYALFPHLDVAANIAFGLEMQRKPAHEISQKVRWAMDLLEIGRFEQRPVSRLSGGEQQRVALARALVTEPSVLLLDEPLSALDLKLREKMQMELLSLRTKLGSTFLFVTHDQSEAMSLSDRIAVMRGGQVMQIGSPEEIYHRPKNRFVAEFIGQANFLPGSKRPLLFGDMERMPTLPEGHHWMVRPEHFTPRKKDWEAPKGFVGTFVRVLETAFLGADRVAKCVDKEGFAYLVKTPGFEPALGVEDEDIVLSWETEDVWTVASS